MDPNDVDTQDEVDTQSEGDTCVQILAQLQATEVLLTTSRVILQLDCGFARKQ